jgi:sialate O-acetylesterase
MRRLTVPATLAAVVLLGSWATPARADIKTHALISDGMVLQQGVKAPVWGTGAPFSTATVHFQGKEFKAQGGGNKTGRWLVYLDHLKAGGPFEMTITGYTGNGGKEGQKANTIHLKNVYVGEVWVCSGQSNMEWPLWATTTAKQALATAKNANIRLFTVPKLVLAKPRHRLYGRWEECNANTARNFSAVAYYFGRELQKVRKVPVGLIHTSWGGTVAEAWTSKSALQAYPDLKYLTHNAEVGFANYTKAAAKYLTDLEQYVKKARKFLAKTGRLPPAPFQPYRDPNTPTALYNGMIAPLLPYAIKGVIWYQGESNAGRAYEYRTLLPALIKNWRDDWKLGNFPFLIVQLAPFGSDPKQPGNSPWAELREAQLLTALHVPKAGLAVITDVGDCQDIHPRNKEPVGYRLALAARALGYGEKVVYSGPVYKAMKVEGKQVFLTFNHIGGGLKAGGTKLEGFTVCGKDHKFVRARAEIKGNMVIVSSSEVSDPVAVRYGWADCPTCNLQNKEGLPASPFRTDHFPMVTGGPKKGKQ